MSPLKLLESVLLQFVFRIALGGLFCVAAFQKLSDPQSFAEAIKGFKVLDASQFSPLIITGAYSIPWVEMTAGILLILGLWTRAAALTICLALLAFIGALLSVIFREIDANCSCFGDLSIGCGSAVGWCQVIRNSILLIPAGYLAWRQGGVLALDHLCERRSGSVGGDAGSGEDARIEFDAVGDRA